MKIEDLSFITEIDQENTNHINGGMDNPFAGVGAPIFSDQMLDIMEQSSDLIWRNFLDNSMAVF